MRNKLSSITSNDGRFHDGNPSRGELGTVVTAQWLNNVQDNVQDFFDELNNVLGLARLSPNAAKKNQLAEAIGQFLQSKLTADTGVGSPNLAFSAAGAKTLAQRIAQNQQAIAGLNSGKVDKTAISNSVSSTSQTNVGSSLAVKTAYDKGVEAKNAADAAQRTANAKQSPATTLAGYGITNFATGSLTTQNLNELTTTGIYGQAANDNATRERNYPEQQAGSIQVLPSAYGKMQIYTTFSSKKVYVRNAAWNGGWDDWKRIDGADWSEVRGKPTTIDGYGITDSIQVENAIYNRSSVDDLLGENKLVPINGGDRETLGFDANMYNYGLLTSLTAGQAKILLYAPHSVGQLWIRNTYGSSKFPWKRVDGADWSDVRRKPTTLEGYGITDAVNTNSLTGAIMYFAMSSAPAGWLKANGAAVSRTTYAALFAKIGTTFGAGDGRTTFNLPDLRGEFIRGWDDGRNVDSSRRLGSWQKGSIFGVDGIDASSAIGVAIKNIRSSPPLKMYEGPNIIGGDQVTFDDVEHVGLRWSGSGGAWANRNQNDGEGGFWTRGNQRNIGSNHFAAMSRPRNIALLACIKY